MLIRSQDKSAIINFDRLNTVVVEDRKELLGYVGIVIYTDAECLTIGEYSAKGKAIEVLDMIQDVYEKANYHNSGFVKNKS